VLRQVINDTAGTFPVDQLEVVMARQGKSLRIDDTVIDDLVEIPYRDRRVFAVLSVLYPGVDTRNEFHIDHVFPKSIFTQKRLEAAGIPAALIPDFRSKFDRLPNLHLLEGPDNESKRNRLPHDWLRTAFPDEGARASWLSAHDLHDLPIDLDDFGEFYDARRRRMRARLLEVLGSDRVDEVPHPQAPRSSQAGDLSLATPTELVAGSASKAEYREDLIDLVLDGRIQVGVEVVCRYRGQKYLARVTSSGHLERNGEVFSSPSHAARVVTGQASVNGWAVWRLPDGTPLAELRRA
jgi:hypothetical protein